VGGGVANRWQRFNTEQEYSSLRELIELREGHSVDLNRIRKLLPSGQEASPQAQLIFVDWFLMDAQIHVCILKDQGDPLVQRCNIEYGAVLSWKIEYLDSEEGRSKSIRRSDDEDNPLRQLDPLVAPLEGMASEGDIFVFSVTDVLHSLPVHALWVEEEPIIENHPVVYSASLTTFVQCQDRSHAQKGDPQTMAVLAAYETADGEFKEDSLEERTNIRKFVEELGRDTGATTFFGSASSKEMLAPALQSCSLVHFHGHCHLNKSAMTDQALVLSDGNFSVRDIFDIKLMALHVTLIACESASQRITAGDEPLGIVSALLYAGASSVLGTIWPIASGCGREFSREFYANMRACNNEGITDLAVALQQTV
jgi:CHAT domain-containing protein